MGKSKATPSAKKKVKAPAHVPNILEDLPPELLKIITDHIDPGDWLPLKLSCKSFAAHLSGTLQRTIETYYDGLGGDMRGELGERQTIRSRDENIKYMVEVVFSRLEARDVNRARLSVVICTCCGQRKPRSAFVDSQAGRLPRQWYTLRTDADCVFLGMRNERCCISCGVDKDSFHYSARRSVQVNRVECFICGRCKMPFALADHEFVFADADKHGMQCRKDTKLCLSCDVQLEEQQLELDD